MAVRKKRTVKKRVPKKKLGGKVKKYSNGGKTGTGTGKKKTSKRKLTPAERARAEKMKRAAAKKKNKLSAAKKAANRKEVDRILKSL